VGFGNISWDCARWKSPDGLREKASHAPLTSSSSSEFDLQCWCNDSEGEKDLLVIGVPSPMLPNYKLRLGVMGKHL